AFLMERALMDTTIKKLRTSAADFNHLTSGYASGSGGSGSSGDWTDELKDDWHGVEIAGAKFMWRTSWTYSDELHMLQSYQVILDAMRTIQTNQSFNPTLTNMVNRLNAMGITNNPEDFWTKLDVPDLRRLFSESAQSLSGIIHRTMSAETSKRIVITAIALKRFQLKHGNFPEKLSELTPEFLASVPLDAVDGNPLRYRRNADGTYLLYSIGQNGVDDGGDPSLAISATVSNFNWQNSRALDWVWPQPATDAEVQYYLAHPPR
ncbi:MAG TPA: hypothetical protein VHQ01_04665, partial [Pyrinomonadaceae bacterium]|nr:hypothetical protein [Pyrinomonadaceae bacterium]